MKSKLHQAALAYVSKGRKVFPVIPGGKKPLTAHGFHDASSDPAQIDRWWGEEPEANIAWCPETEGLCCIDVDGEEGKAALVQLEIDHGTLPETYTVQTPRGGWHLYYKGELPPSQSTLAPHIDTRGVGSYALLPPSRHSGREYRVIGNFGFATLPDFIPGLIAASRKAKATSHVDDLDLPHNLAAAANALREMVRRGEIAIEGHGGNKQTYVAAATALNFGLSAEAALEVVKAEYNPHCLPPWEPEELSELVSNAERYAQNEAGAWGHSEEALAEYDAIREKYAAETKAPEKRKHLHTFTALASRPPPSWLIPDLIMERGSVLLYGPPKVFKSTVVLDVALHVASGMPGWGREATTPQQVVYVAGEAAEDIARKAQRWCEARFVDPVAVPLHLYDYMPPIVADLSKRDEMIDEWVEAGLKPDLIILDTAAKALRGMNENDSRDVGKFADLVDDMRQVFGCAVLAIHHAPKEGGGPRGSIVFTADFDTVHSLERAGSPADPLLTLKNEAQRLAVEREDPWRFSVVNNELVPLTPGEAATRRRAADPLSQASIMSALVALGGGPVSTDVLLSKVVGHFDDPSDHEKAISRAKKQIGSRFDLGAFYTGLGSEKRWRLPDSLRVGLAE